MYLLAKDALNGAEGKVIITVNGRNIEVAGMKNITINAEYQSNDMRVIGTRTIQDKPNGAKLTGSGTIYYGSNLFTDMVLDYIQNGKITEFDIQVVNNDPATTVGQQSMVVYGCHLTGTIPIAILNDEEAMLTHEFNFAYTRVARTSKFKDPAQYGN